MKHGPRSPTVLQINAADVGGGAERMARSLHDGFLERGLRAWLAVGRRQSDHPTILEIPRPVELPRLHRALLRLTGPKRSTQRAVRLARAIASPRRALSLLSGREDFHHPGSRGVLQLCPSPPDLVHLHNLHGGYFDLRILPEIAGRFPTVLTLHDEWTLTGHCAYTLGCERWRIGCGECPDLTIPPAIYRDRTRRNLSLKSDLYSSSRLHVVTPSRWLAERAGESVLAQGASDIRVIHNGVDRRVFHPSPKSSVRDRLQLPQDAFVLLFAANRATTNRFKDLETLERAVDVLFRQRFAKPIVFLVLGAEASTERRAGAEKRFIAFERDPSLVARYYQAADLYLHAAHGDNFPTTILEALACGTPVVATAVGGIPEQISSYGRFDRRPEGKRVGLDRATGVLVPPADAAALAQAVQALLNEPDALAVLSRNSAASAASEFDLERQITAHLEHYDEILFHDGRTDTERGAAS